MNLYPPSGSRKLTGLYVGIAALLLLAVIGVVCWALFGLPESLFASIAGGITTITGVHQGAQSAADRSAFYNTPISQPPAAQPPIPPRVP